MYVCTHVCAITCISAEYDAKNLEDLLRDELANVSVCVCVYVDVCVCVCVFIYCVMSMEM